MTFNSENKSFVGQIVDFKEDNGRILYKVWVPELMGPDVKYADLPFVPATQPPSMGGGTTSGGAMNVGQLVTMFKGKGQSATGFGTITGLFHPVNSDSRTMSGENTSISSKISMPLEATKRNIRLPPDLQRVLNAKGVEVTKAIEKGLHSLETIYGLASHGVQAPLNGVPIPSSKGVPTAKQSSSQSLGSNILANLPGSSFSIGNLLDILPTKLQEELFKNMPADVASTLKTITKMAPKFQAGNFGGMGVSSAPRVDAPSFGVAAVAALKNIKTVDDLIPALLSLMNDTGGNDLNHFVEIVNGFGHTKIQITKDGTVIPTVDSETIKAITQFKSMISTFEAPSGTLFDQVNDLPGMIDRLKPEVAGSLNTVLTKIKNDTPAVAANLFVKS